MSAKTISGARAKVYVNNKLIGIVNSINYSHNLGVVPVQTLGRFTTNELVMTSSEPISGSMSGFRVLNNGMYRQGESQDAGITNSAVELNRLQDLLSAGYTTVQVIDRQTDVTLANIKDVVITGYNVGINAKDIANVSINFIGISIEDEGGIQAEVSPVTF
jgi:hypothetical protein